MQASKADLHLSNIQQSKLTEGDLKELRAMCVDSSLQKYIGEKLSKGLLRVLFDEVISIVEKQHSPSLESFFLQLLGNLITGNPVNAAMVYGQFFEDQESNFTEKLKIMFDTEKNKKFIHIFFHNLLFALKQTIEWKVLANNKQIRLLTRLILSDLKSHSQDHSQDHPVDPNKQANFEWKCSIIKVLYDFPKQLSSESKEVLSTTQFLFENCEINRIEVAHLLYLLLEKIIHNQSTPTLVKGIIPHSEIIELYKKPYNMVFLLEKNDLEYLKICFQSTFKEFKSRAAAELSKQPSSTEPIKEDESFEFLFQIVQIFNCANFLGGYNHPVQEIFEPILPEFCQLLETLFILYSFDKANNLKNTAFKEIPQASMTDEQKRQREQKAKLIENQITSLEVKLQNLRQILNCPHINQSLIGEYFTHHLNSRESLGNTLRLLSNLIHINPQAQKYFQVHFKYLYICMSLTHLDPSQQSMREWSLLFIRNVCEVSESLRQRIQDLKVEVKMQ